MMSSDVSSHSHSKTDVQEYEMGEKSQYVQSEHIDHGHHIDHHKHDSLRTHLRPYDDHEDHEHEPKLNFKRFMAFLAMAFLWTGSQIPIYFYGGISAYVYRDLGGHDRWTWFIIGYLLALASICPFVGSLSDLFGRRYVALVGALFLVVGQIVCGTAQSMNVFICGMTLSGVGAGVEELTALAATSEMAPTSKRGTYVAVLIFSIVPFCPSVLYGGLIAYYSTWRYCSLVCGIWCGIGFIMTAIFYFPPPRPNSSGLTRREIISSVDYMGGFLSISGMILFMAGLQWGGYQYTWHSAHTLIPLILGVVLLAAFVVWEKYGAKNPMFPAGLKENPRVMMLTLIITFISGANFFSVLMFWPTQAYNVYGHDPIGVGVRGLPVGFGILIGACIVLYLLTLTRGHIRILMVGSSVMMVTGCGLLSIATAHNLHVLWGPLIVGGLGIGGIIVPASIITTIVCPDDLIATVAALTLAIRVIGGVIGYTTYYNVFINKVTPIFKTQMVQGLIKEAHVYNITLITEIVEATSISLTEPILGWVKNNQTKYDIIIRLGQEAYAAGYIWVYYTSIAFGGIAIIASLFLGDISEYMDDHVAVVIH